MRSRYCAYVGSIVDYVMATTHPENSAFQADKAAWGLDLRAFCDETKFGSLQILETDPKADTVTFKVIMRQATLDATFTEKSQFKKDDSGRWLYIDGDVTEDALKDQVEAATAAANAAKASSPD